MNADKRQLRTKWVIRVYLVFIGGPNCFFNEILEGGDAAVDN